MGVLPLVLVQSRLFGRILCSVPFVNYGGICANDDNVASLLVRSAMVEAQRLGVDYFELRSAQPLAVDLPVSDRKVSLTIELDDDPERLWGAFSSKHRNNIRRAQKQRLEVTIGGQEQLSAFYKIMEQSWHALGTPLYSRDFFAHVIRRFGDLTRIFVCRQDGAPVAAAFNGYFNGTVEGLWAGMSPEARRLQANYVLYWEMIRDACEGRFRKFNLGRSTADSGGADFKKRWNASVRQLYWYYYQPEGGKLPALNVDNPQYRMASRIWRCIPLNLLRRIGPKLAPLIP